MIAQDVINSEENVVRILSKGWVVNGTLQHTAFMLRDGETYISVNRPAVDSYVSDVASFVKGHKSFITTQGNIISYQRAILNVGDIRNIVIKIEDQTLAVDVEVEPRDVFTKSHAGIFTRFNNNNVKTGSTLAVSQEKNLSADVVLLKVRLALVRLSSVDTCYI